MYGVAYSTTKSLDRVLVSYICWIVILSYPCALQQSAVLDGRRLDSPLKGIVLFAYLVKHGVTLNDSN